MDDADGKASQLKPNSGQSKAVGVDESSTNDALEVLLTRHPDLVMVRNTPKGRGVFATATIPARTIVDISPVLVLDPNEAETHIKHTKLWFYTYNWRPLGGSPTQALPLGLGSLFNHASSRSRAHNTGFMRDVVAETISYLTLRDVHAGEELCICYGEDARLGFLDSDKTINEGSEDGMVNRAELEDERKENGVENVDVDVFQDGS